MSAFRDRVTRYLLLANIVYRRIAEVRGANSIFVRSLAFPSSPLSRTIGTVTVDTRVLASLSVVFFFPSFSRRDR